LHKKIHIVAFDIPYPPNYGGVIDIYYKCKHLYKLGIKIELHCFEYGRKRSVKLEKYCSKINYYKRKKWVYPFSHIPYIVASRQSNLLISNLNKDTDPILLEGLHCAGVLLDKKINPKRCYVRTHNVEHHYYAKLALLSTNFLKKTYYKFAAKKLAVFENILTTANGILAISKADFTHFSKYNKTHWISAFHSSNTVNINKNIGQYALYHGNLSVEENDNAACFLAENVFSKVDIPCIISGNGPSKKLLQLCKNTNITLLSKTSSKKITSLIQNAQINVLITFQQTGIKLKLLNALFKGKFCLVNHEMVADTGLDKLCIIATDANDMIEKLNELKGKIFSEQEIAIRKELLSPDFMNNINAEKLVEIIFSSH